jgi:hypothetical protein
MNDEGSSFIPFSFLIHHPEIYQPERFIMKVAVRSK